MGSYTLIEILNCAAEILIIFLFCGHIWDRRFSSKAVYVSAFLCGTAVFSFAALFIDDPYVRVCVTFGCVIAAALLLYKNEPASALFASAYYMLMVMVSETLFMDILAAAEGISPEQLLGSGAGRTVGIIGTKIFDLWFVVYSCRLYRRKAVRLPAAYWVQMLLMPFLSAVIICCVFSARLTNIGGDVMYAVSLAGLLYINISVFNYFESYDRQVRLAALEQTIEREEKNYRELSASYSEIRSIKHDLRNQAGVLNEMLEKEHYNEAKEYIRSLYKTVGNVTDVYFTGDAAVDSIINLKAAYAKSLGISFSADIKTEYFGSDRLALCRILGNALDNAVEACERVSGERHIDLEISRAGEMLMCTVGNTSLPVDVNRLVTQKRGKGMHGIGMQSIKNAVKAMDGHYTCRFSDGRFIIKILVSDRKH